MYLYKGNDLQENYFSWCLSTMKKRGPDSKKTWQNSKNYITAFARLAIRDLSEHGDQPMLSDDNNCCISFNGEIYNTNELAQKLRPYRSSFKSTSDTELLLYALIHLGVEKTLGLIDGMFAFAFYDVQKNKLILARDRVGIKPLYIGTSAKGIVYSSQYDHVINHPFFKDQGINESAISSYLSLGYMAENSGIINNTYLMPHGYYAVVENESIKTFNYYSYSICSDGTTKTFDEVLEDSVNKQLISDVQVGTFMSGGIDSNLVTYFANHHKNFQSFTIGVGDKELNEAEQAKAFADIFHTNNYCKYITSGDLLTLIKDNALAYNEPFADYSSLPTLVLSQFTKEKVTVALSGDGGDELFWGYPRNKKALDVIALYKKNLASRRLKLLSEKIRKPSVTDLSRHWNHKDFVSYYYSALSITGALHWLPQVYKTDEHSSFFFHESEKLYSDDMSTSKLMNIIRKMEVDIHLQRILLKVDRASMYYSLEVRVPFLGNDMLDYSLSCNYSDCIKQDHGKIILKNSLAAKTNEALVFQKKKGFRIPLDEWIRKEIKNDITDTILNMPAHLSTLFYKDKLERLLQAHMSGKYNWGWFIWALYSLVTWDATHRNKFTSCV